ncbi:MAG: hypothetical protein UR27_C0021G0040 [Candidatus Peregrinibacteria bacterium GW2011_GWA2_33_10]|nr:MAG: hypothetical protein UR27_C0021G0040 [Candidatus Peregrinibacteria bacterium GW2011_GWA2_33_10]KKP40977.1 MAG: beta-lactamase domain-containing protein [Candidatus Peregrinibacteria bacterium GW2011_GWC2_33_13]
MYFKQIDIGGFDNNFSYIVGDELKKEVFLVDPDKEKILSDIISKDNLKVVGIILTHGHFDHVGDSPSLSHKFKAPIYLRKEDFSLLRVNLPNLIDLSEIKVLKAGDLEIQILHTPGHSRGSVCLLIDGKLLTGDTVFVGCCGRTDLQESDPEAFKKSLGLIKNLPDDIEIWPGHDYGNEKFSTVKKEMKRNENF